VDSCFWHQCPLHGTSPKANVAWWDQKPTTNVSRDLDTDQRLARTGWRVIQVWEHEDPNWGADRIERRESYEHSDGPFHGRTELALHTAVTLFERCRATDLQFPVFSFTPSPSEPEGSLW
jgi:hypothetical protein